MNSIAAANLFDNPLVLVAIVLFGALSNWLMKRRQAGADDSPNEDESPPAPGEQGRSTRQLDWQDVWRQLLGGEPPPLAPSPPPIPRASYDEQTLLGVETNEHQETAPDPVAQVNEPARPPVRGMRTAHGRHPSVGGRAAHLWREPRAVRRAFIASLVFAPPKSLEP